MRQQFQDSSAANRKEKSDDFQKDAFVIPIEQTAKRLQAQIFVQCSGIRHCDLIHTWRLMKRINQSKPKRFHTHSLQNSLPLQ